MSKVLVDSSISLLIPVLSRGLSLTINSRMPFYAVARGKIPGIYATWPECQAQIVGFGGAKYKKFPTMTEAKEFVQQNAAHNPVVDRHATKEKTTSHYNSNDVAPVSRSNSQDGSVSPTLQEMKKGMKKLQKELSDLRTKFDQYIANRYGGGINSSSMTQGAHTSSFAAEKRKHPSDGDDDDDADSGSSKEKLAKDDKSKFSTDSDEFVIVYTDGACQLNGRRGAQAGVGVFFGHDHPLNVSEPVRGRATNNMAEIQAATYAVELAQAAGFKRIAVHTDSEFMINCMTSWIKNWKKKDWVKKDGEPVKNKEELIALDRACFGLAVKWVHVRGHQGHEGNEEADRLAREGAKLYKEEN